MPTAPSLSSEQLVRSRLRAALEYVQDVISDADLLTLEARTHVLAALSALTEALALVHAKED